MTRCPDCNKFVELEQAELEVEADVDEEREKGKSEATITVTGRVNLVLNCADCGIALKEANLDLGMKKMPFVHEKPDCAGVLDVEVKGETTDRFEGSGRYAKHFYGADISANVTCSDCGVEIEETCMVEEQASSFKECC